MGWTHFKALIPIDDEDYYLDLLFYHRKLRRLVAVDLKLGVFEADDKGQMELYLNWLKKHEQGESTDDPADLDGRLRGESKACPG